MRLKVSLKFPVHLSSFNFTQSWRTCKSDGNVNAPIWEFSLNTWIWCLVRGFCTCAHTRCVCACMWMRGVECVCAYILHFVYMCACLFAARLKYRSRNICDRSLRWQGSARCVLTRIGLWKSVLRAPYFYMAPHMLFSLHKNNFKPKSKWFTIAFLGAAVCNVYIVYLQLFKLLKKTITTVSGGSLGSLVEEERS